MELRGQDKDMGMSMGYSTLTQPHQESSSKLSSASLATTVAERKRNDQTGLGSTALNPTQTLDHHHLHQQLNLQQQQQQQIYVPGRDSNPDPDPDPAPAPAPLPSATIASASNSKTSLPPQPQPTTLATNSAAPIRYRECLKNHAASMGGHVVDGCGEFMPSGEEGTPEGLKCAACDCHRNFHRKEVEGEPQSGANSYYPYNPNRNSSHRTTPHLAHVPPSLPPPPQHHRYSHGYSHGLSTSPTTGPVPPVMMAFGGAGGAPAESSSEDLNMFHPNAGTQPPFPQSKKRFRTKFTQEQKDRMQEFGERLGWKIQKQDEQEVQQFCAEVGVKRQVFKVWMHNNKQAMKKKQL